MSLEATRWASSAAPRSKGAARALLLILADMANAQQGHACWPKVETLAARMGCSERSVQRYLTQLDAVGDVIVSVRPGRGKRNVITFPALSDVRKGDNPVTFSTPEKVADPARKGDRSVTPINQPESNLSTSNQKTSTVQSDDDDLAAPFRADLASIANRTLKAGEVEVINAAAADDAGRRLLVVALDRLRAWWPDIGKKWDVSGWLASTLRNLADEDAPLTEAETRHRRYEADPVCAAAIGPETIDKLRLEHAIDPEPLPPHSALWAETLAALNLELAPGTYTYLQLTTAVAGDDDTLTVKVPNQYALEFLRHRLHRVCERTLRSVAGRHVAIQWVPKGGQHA